MNDEAKYVVFVKVDMTIQVRLPEGLTFLDDDNEIISDECKERAIESALGALPQQISIYIDGENSDPADVYIDVSDNNVEEVWVEED